MSSSSDDLSGVKNELNRRMAAVGWCASFPASDAFGLLANREINVNQLFILIDCLGSVGRSWDFQECKQVTEEESLIATRARELIDLLGRADHDNGWRYAWDSDYEEIESSIKIDQFIDDLETLAQNAEQRLEQFTLAKNIGLHPQSGKIRYFYWMSLIAFWKFALGRDVKASDNGKNRPSGPMVAFVETMSFGMTGRVSPGAIRKFVERHRDEVDKFARTFLPSLVVRLHYLANGR